MQFAVDRVSNCDCGAETSCYGCLRSYRNDRHHDKLSRSGALEIFKQLKIEATREAVRGPWGETLTHTSAAVVELFAELSRHEALKPEIGIDIGQFYWPVEAVWNDSGVVLVEGEDDDRDRDLTEEGFTVFNVAATNAEEILSAVGGR